MAKKAEIAKMVDDANMNVQTVQQRIFIVRGQQVMLDRDLAQMYGVTTSRLNEQVKRNIVRFPVHFRFQLTDIERDEVIANCDHLADLKFSPSLPYAFTEQGVAMLSAVLRSEMAIKVSVQIMEAFVEMRHTLAANDHIVRRLETIEHHQLSLAQHQAETDNRLEEVFRRLDEGQVKQQQGIFFDGQVYDAYQLVSGIIRKAKEQIILIDNYIDETVLTLLDKRAKGVKATVYTKHIGKQLQLDMEKHNKQYTPIEVLTFGKAHDRFLCVDDDVYHIGASIKDLGKSWCAFTQMRDFTAKDLLNKIK